MKSKTPLKNNLKNGIATIYSEEGCIVEIPYINDKAD